MSWECFILHLTVWGVEPFVTHPGLKAQVNVLWKLMLS